MNKALNSEYLKVSDKNVFYIGLRMAAVSEDIDGTDIRLEDIVAESDGVEPKRILLTGCAGMGKTTTIHEILSRWCQSRMWEKRYDFVFPFDCRTLNQLIRMDVKLSLKDLLKRMQMPNLSEEDQFAIFRNLFETESSRRTLYLFDAIDELIGWSAVSREVVSPITDVNAKQGIAELVGNILYSNMASQSTAIATTRPITCIRRTEFDRVIDVMGFSRRAIQECIEILCKKRSNEYKPVLEILLNDNHLTSLCSIPLNCILLGKALKGDVIKEGDVMDRYTTIFIFVILATIKRRCQETFTNR